MKNILKLILLITCLSFTQVVYATDLLKPATTMSVDFVIKSTKLSTGGDLIIEAAITGTNFATTSFKIYQNDRLVAEDKDMTITNHTTAKPIASWAIPDTFDTDQMFIVDVLVKDGSGIITATKRKEFNPSTLDKQAPLAQPNTEDTTNQTTTTPNTTTTTDNNTTTPNTITNNGQENLNDYKIILNGKEVSLADTEKLIIYNGVLYTPVKGIINYMGYNSSYTPLDKTITLSKDNVTLTLKVDDKTLTKGSDKQILNAPALEINGTAYFPINEVGMTINYRAYVDKTAKTITFIEISTDPAKLAKLDRTKLDNNTLIPLTTQIKKLDLVFPNESILAKNEWAAIILDSVSEHKISYKYSFLGDGTFSRYVGFRKANTWDFMLGDVGKFTVDHAAQTLKLEFLLSKGSNTIKSTEIYNIAYSRVDSRLYYYDKTDSKFKLFGTELSKF